MAHIIISQSVYRTAIDPNTNQTIDMKIVSESIHEGSVPGPGGCGKSMFMMDPPIFMRFIRKVVN